MIDIHSAFSQHLLQLTVTDAVFAVPAYGPQNDVTLKMPAFEWFMCSSISKRDDKFITTDYLQQCLKNYGELSDLRLALFLFFCRSGLSRASDTSGAGDGFLMRVSAWEAPCA
ncbi:hypothetical protein CQA67_31240 [Klebsiella pneumoniae]|nr:hypothetical protein CQA67_31240 [Klebsiella pneumoniae]